MMADTASGGGVDAGAALKRRAIPAAPSLDRAAIVAVDVATRGFRNFEPLARAWRPLSRDLLSLMSGLRPAVLIDYIASSGAGTAGGDALLEALSTLLARLAASTPAARGLVVLLLGDGFPFIAHREATLAHLRRCEKRGAGGGGGGGGGGAPAWITVGRPATAPQARAGWPRNYTCTLSHSPPLAHVRQLSSSLPAPIRSARRWRRARFGCRPLFLQC